MPTTSAILPRSVSLVDRLLASPQVASAFNNGDDPLAINLPPLGGGAGNAQIDRETLEVMAAMYFQAELEQAGVIPVTEVLADSRFQLQVRDPDAANRLENFARQMQGEWYPRQIREQLFARTFGVGPAAVAQAGTTINREFETRFGQLCVGLDRYQAEARWAPATSGAAVRVEMAMKAVLTNLAQRRFGNTLMAARRIQMQLKAALELLNHRGVTTLFQAQNIWAVIRNILGNEAPDLARLIDRAQAGTRILDWMAGHLADIRSGAISRVLIQESALFRWAANWLQASGFTGHGVQPGTSPVPGIGQSGYGNPAVGGIGGWSG